MTYHAPVGADLTDVEREVLEALADGDSCKAIAAKRHVTSNTTHTQIVRIREKLGAINTAHAVAIALRGGIIR